MSDAAAFCFDFAYILMRVLRTGSFCEPGAQLRPAARCARGRNDTQAARRVATAVRGDGARRADRASRLASRVRRAQLTRSRFSKSHLSLISSIFSSSHSVLQITDTALAKLLALEADGTALRALFSAPNACAAEEVEPLLHSAGMYASLAQLHLARGEMKQTLELWTKLVDGELQDAAWEGDVGDVVGLLEECREQELVREWGVWVVQRDAEAGIRVSSRRFTGRWRT